MARPIPALMQDFLTEKEAAFALNLSTETLKKWRSNKKGPTYCKVGGRVLYQSPDLAEWLAEEVRKTRVSHK